MLVRYKYLHVNIVRITYKKEKQTRHLSIGPKSHENLGPNFENLNNGNSIYRTLTMKFRSGPKKNLEKQ